MRSNSGADANRACAAEKPRRSIARPDQIAAHAYPVVGGKVQRGGVDLAPFVKDGKLTWTAPEGEWEVWIFRRQRHGGSLNPLMAGAGETVIRDWFQPFQDHNPGKSSKGLNYFFNDELQIGVGKFAWNPDFAAEFRKRKGYDLFEVLPAMWDDMGSITPKVRMDYADVRMALMEERYFKPIYTWHASRGMIFACDPGGRGTDPHEFGDYFRAIRWYSAPGHDTPGGNADLIKGKVSSSIADLYQRPRVWLEGYHSLGWGATPERLMHATRENYLYGCTLLNLHGLYYTTYGSYWEWAPPCYHFRMPYWAHMGTFLGYFERLSYLLSQGHLVCDVAVVYPVAPFEAEMNGEKAKNTAFELAHKLFAAGINFEFIDNDSLARATIEKDRLVVKDAGASYQALVVPNMEAVRWATIEKAAAFAQAGGKVYSVGAVPTVSDHAGRDDPALAALVETRFQTRLPPGEERRGGQGYQQRLRAGRAQPDQDRPRAASQGRQPRCLHGYGCHARHRGRIPRQGRCRTVGSLDWEDPPPAGDGGDCDGNQGRTAAGILRSADRRLHSGQAARQSAAQGRAPRPATDLAHGVDGRLSCPPWTTPTAISDCRSRPKTRRSVLKRVVSPGPAKPRRWPRPRCCPRPMIVPGRNNSTASARSSTCSVPFLTTPIPPQLDVELAKLASVDPSQPVSVKGKTFTWKPYEFSWRMGKEGDSGHQGYHGLKRTVTDDFLCLGQPAGGLNETRYDTREGRKDVLSLDLRDRGAGRDGVHRGQPNSARGQEPYLARDHARGGLRKRNPHERSRATGPAQRRGEPRPGPLRQGRAWPSGDAPTRRSRAAGTHAAGDALA